MGVSSQERDFYSSGKCLKLVVDHTDSHPPLQAKEGRALKGPDTKYYAELRDKLDLVLTFTENGWLCSHCYGVLEG